MTPKLERLNQHWRRSFSQPERSDAVTRQHPRISLCFAVSHGRVGKFYLIPLLTEKSEITEADVATAIRAAAKCLSGGAHKSLETQI